MCVNLKTFNESFRQWAEEREDEPEFWPTEDTQIIPEKKKLLLADLDRNTLIAEEKKGNAKE
jgi:hypothetical protein